MARTIVLETEIPADIEKVWQEVRTSRLLHYITRGFVRFVPTRTKPFPEIWVEGEYRAWLLLFGFIPIGWQIIAIEDQPPEGEVRRIRDNGRRMMIRTWDHMIEIKPSGMQTHYVDQITVEAGILTPLVASFAKAFYAHRQRRWVRLAQNGFDYDR